MTTQQLKQAPEREIRRRGRGEFGRGSGRTGEFEVIDQGTETGPARSIEGWDLIVTGINEVRKHQPLLLSLSLRLPPSSDRAVQISRRFE